MPHLLFVVKLAWLLSHGLPVGFGAKVNAGGCNANAGTLFCFGREIELLLVLNRMKRHSRFKAALVSIHI